MKLTYLSASTIPSRQANSIHVMKMCQAFARLGHDVTLHARFPVGSPADAMDVFAAYDVAPIFRLERVRSYRVNALNILRSILTTLRARRLEPELVYTRDLWSAVASLAIGMATIYEIHEYSAFERPVHRRAFRYVLGHPRLRRVVAISAALRSDVVADYPAFGDRIIVAHDAADPVSADRARQAKAEPRNGRLQVGYVGHLYPGKGSEVIPELALRAPFADFHIVGGDAASVRRTRHAQLPSNVIVHGFKPFSEAETLRLQCDVLIAPFQRTISVTEGGRGDIARWTSPLKLFEYMAAGKAILCSDLPVLREVLESDRTAILLPPDDLTAWTAALRRLAEDVPLRLRLGEEAQREFLARFTWQKRAGAVLES